jgi:diacylglycerol kinase (ATP)
LTQDTVYSSPLCESLAHLNEWDDPPLNDHASLPLAAWTSNIPAIAPMTATPRTLLLHNPTAGAGHPSKDDLVKAVRKFGFDPIYHSAKDKSYIAALRESWDLVIVAGGDGTVARAARGLKNRNIPIAILPIGTANNIARSVGIVGELEVLLPRLSTAESRCLDVGVAKGPWGKRIFLEAIGLGPIAEAISHSGPKPPKAIRIDSGRDSLQDFVREAEAERWEITVDDEVLVGEFLLVEILNTSFSGPSLPIAFSAAPDDHQLDVVFLFESERGKMLGWLAERPEATPPPVTVRTGRRVRLKWKRGYLRVDSEVYLPPKKTSRVEIKLQKKSLRVLVPRS